MHYQLRTNLTISHWYYLLGTGQSTRKQSSTLQAHESYVNCERRNSLCSVTVSRDPAHFLSHQRDFKQNISALSGRIKWSPPVWLHDSLSQSLYRSPQPPSRRCEVTDMNKSSSSSTSMRLQAAIFYSYEASHFIKYLGRVSIQTPHWR